jgi:excisionase family DNA binding protein
MARNIGATETAERLGISVRTLDRMEHDGRLRPVTRIGGRRKYDEDQVERVRRGEPAVPPPSVSTA